MHLVGNDGHVCACVLRGKSSHFKVLNYISSAKGRLEEDGMALKEETHYVNCFVMEVSNWGSCTTSRARGIILTNRKPALDLWNSKYLQVQKALTGSQFVFIIPFLKSHRLMWKTELEGWTSHKFISGWNSVCLILCVISAQRRSGHWCRQNSS